MFKRDLTFDMPTCNLSQILRRSSVDMASPASDDTNVFISPQKHIYISGSRAT
jgi:hypothetical protein